MEQKILLVVGSPKGLKSTSAALGQYLIDKLTQQGARTETAYIYPSLKTETGQQKFFSLIDATDIIVLAFPLYVDSPPSGVMKVMEIIKERRRTLAGTAKQKLAVIINCGFPEAHQNDTALAICRKFAAESEMEWLGGLSLGGGGAIDGRPLDSIGGMARNVKLALDASAPDIAVGNPISGRALDLMAKPMMPVWLYLLAGNRGWKSQSRKNGVSNRINDCPHG